MDQNSKKRKVAESVLDLIENGEILGIGSGSTVNILIEYLPKVKNKIQDIVSSSVKSTELLKANGFDVNELRAVGKLSKYIDGADEVNKYLHMIKGGGGALTREKIIAGASNKFLCIVDESKVVDVLGKFPLPIEILPMARSFVAREIIKNKGMPVWRENFITDNGNLILDINHMDIIEPIKLEKDLNQIPGILTVGLFAERPADKVLVSNEKEVVELKKAN